VGHIIPRDAGSITDTAQVLTPSQIGDAGYQVRIQTNDRAPMLAVYSTPGGQLLALNPDDVAWLSELGDLPTELDHHYAGLRLVQYRKSALFVADLIHVITPASYGTDPETGASVRHAAVTENLGPRVVGMLMGITLSQ
jgi:hypothetical protein